MPSTEESYRAMEEAVAFADPVVATLEDLRFLAIPLMPGKHTILGCSVSPCRYTCVYIYMYINISLFSYLSIYIHVHVYIYIHIYIYAYVNMNIYVCIYAFLFGGLYGNMNEGCPETNKECATQQPSIFVKLHVFAGNGAHHMGPAAKLPELVVLHLLVLIAVVLPQNSERPLRVSTKMHGVAAVVRVVELKHGPGLLPNSMGIIAAEYLDSRRATPTPGIDLRPLVLTVEVKSSSCATDPVELYFQTRV